MVETRSRRRARGAIDAEEPSGAPTAEQPSGVPTAMAASAAAARSSVERSAELARPSATAPPDDVPLRPPKLKRVSFSGRVESPKPSRHALHLKARISPVVKEKSERARLRASPAGKRVGIPFQDA